MIELGGMMLMVGGSLVSSASVALARKALGERLRRIFAPPEGLPTDMRDLIDRAH